MVGCRRAAGRPRPVRGAAALVAAAAAALIAVTPCGVGGQEVPMSPFPRALSVVFLAGTALFSNTGIEAPFEFRLNAAILMPLFDCVGVYAHNERAYTTWDGGPVRRAARADRTDDNLGVCGAMVVVSVLDHQYGAVGSAAMYTALEAAGFDAPRLNDTTRCGGRGGGRGDRRPDPADPTCVGLATARHYISAHLKRDGMNEDGRTGLPPGAPPRPFADTVSGYRPVNGPAAGLTKLTRWMPLEEDVAGLGTYTVQKITAAHAGLARPVMADASRLRRLRVPPPYRSPDAYRPDFTCDGRAADPDRLCDKARGAVAEVSRLDDRRRTLVRWFDRKSPSIANLVVQLFLQDVMSLADYLTVDLALSAFTWDVTIAVWAEKLRHDAVRPATLVPAILGHTRDGAAFTSAIRTMPHAEYPSASAATCSGFAHIFTAASGGAVNLTVPLAAGEVGGGLPATATALKFRDADQIAALCGQSRLWGGLHFPDAVDAGARLGVAVAKEVLRVVACRAPGAPGLPPCRGGGGKAAEREADSADSAAEYV